MKQFLTFPFKLIGLILSLLLNAINTISQSVDDNQSK